MTMVIGSIRCTTMDSLILGDLVVIENGICRKATYGHARTPGTTIYQVINPVSAQVGDQVDLAGPDTIFQI